MCQKHTTRTVEMCGGFFLSVSSNLLFVLLFRLYCQLIWFIKRKIHVLNVGGLYLSNDDTIRHIFRPVIPHRSQTVSRHV